MTEKYTQKEYDFVDLKLDIRVNRYEVEERVGKQIADEQWDSIVPHIEDVESYINDKIMDDLSMILDDVVDDWEQDNEQ